MILNHIIRTYLLQVKNKVFLKYFPDIIQVLFEVTQKI